MFLPFVSVFRVFLLVFPIPYSNGHSTNAPILFSSLACLVSVSQPLKWEQKCLFYVITQGERELMWLHMSCVLGSLALESHFAFEGFKLPSQWTHIFFGSCYGSQWVTKCPDQLKKKKTKNHSWEHCREMCRRIISIGIPGSLVYNCLS